MSRDVTILDLDVPLVEQLRGEGELLARGSFDLDEERAREKLQSFQLVSPQHYVLELLGCASLMGARRIDYRVSNKKMEMFFDGESFTRGELEGIYSSAFDRSLEPRRRAQRHLAVALSAAEGITLSSLVIESGYEEFARLTVTPGAPDVLDEPGQLSDPGTKVTAQERFKMAHLFGGLAGEPLEVGILREYAAYSRIGVWVNGACVSFGMRLPESRYDLLTFVRTPAEYGKIGLRYSERARDHRQFVTTAWLIQNGVFVSKHTLSWPYGKVDMIIDSRRLTKNLSQSAFVEDDAWHQLHDDVLEEALCWLIHNRVRMAYEWPGASAAVSTPTHVRDWIDMVLYGALERAAARRRDGKPLGEHMKALVAHAEHRPVVSLDRKGSVSRTLVSLGLGLEHARAPRYAEAGSWDSREGVFEEDARDLVIIEDYLGRDAVHSATGEVRARAVPWRRTDEPDVEEEQEAPQEVVIGLRVGGEPEPGAPGELELPELQLGAFYMGEREDAPEQDLGGRVEAEVVAEVAFEVFESAPAEREDLEGWLLALLAPATRAALAWTQPFGVLIERGARVSARLRLGQLVLDARMPELVAALGEDALAREDLEAVEGTECDAARAAPVARRVLSELLVQARLGRAARLATQRALIEACAEHAYAAPEFVEVDEARERVEDVVEEPS